jgi:hypothetical protein
MQTPFAIYSTAMPWPLEQLLKEWDVIKQAPLSFFIVLALCMMLAYFFMRYMYKEALSQKDDVIGTYKERLGLEPKDKAELKGKDVAPEGAKNAAEEARVNAVKAHEDAKKEIERLESENKLLASVVPCPDTSLHDAARKVHTSFEQFVRVESGLATRGRRGGVQSHLTVNIPLTISNYSLYPILVEAVDGVFLYAGQELRGAPQLSAHTSPDLEYGDKRMFTVSLMLVSGEDHARVWPEFDPTAVSFANLVLKIHVRGLNTYRQIELKGVDK